MQVPCKGQLIQLLSDWDDGHLSIMEETCHDLVPCDFFFIDSIHGHGHSKLKTVWDKAQKNMMAWSKLKSIDCHRC